MKRLPEGFTELAEGSTLSAEEVSKRAADNWYVTASEALEHGLVAGLV